MTLSRQQKDQLAYIHANTSLKVQAWIDERLEANYRANPWAEAQLKEFLQAHAKFGSGVQALRYLEGGEHEQLGMEGM